MQYEKFIKALEKKQLDAMLVLSPANLFYASGFTGGEAYLLLTRDTRFLFTDSRYTEQAAMEAPDFTVRQITQKTFMTMLKDTVLDQGIKSLGFEESCMTYREYESFSTALPVRLEKAESVFDQLRAQKEPWETERIKTAQQIAEAAFQALLPRLRPDMTEREIAAFLENEMRQSGADKTSFDTIVASGVRGALPHGTATDKPVAKGELITMDFGCIYRGYCSDMTRTVALGTPDPLFCEIYDIVKEAQTHAFLAGTFGASLKDLDKAARGYIEGKGYGDRFGHGLSHGIGIEIHEPLDTAAPLPVGAVFSVEPGIYLPAKGGVRIENLAVMTEEGIQSLNATNTSLIVL